MQIHAGKSRLSNPNTQSASQNLLISLLQQKKRNEEESLITNQIMRQNLKLLEQDENIQIIRNKSKTSLEKMNKKSRPKSNAKKFKNMHFLEKNFERNTNFMT